MSFENFGLLAELLLAISEKGYKNPTPIQNQAIPLILEGGDLIAGAQTGTGKTASFTLPVCQLLMKNKEAGASPFIRALILTPTRELAAQVEESIKIYSKYLPLKSLVVFGGVNIAPQISHLKNGIDILVATPGRLLDLVQQKAVDLSHIEIFILDEADRMLNMGFILDIKKVLALLPKKRQNLLFSATFSNEIKKLADSLLNSPKSIQATQRNSTADSISHTIYPVDSSRKRELLAHLIKGENWKQVLVFTRTKHGANRLTKQLTLDGISAAAIHGNKSQNARTQALANFKQGTVRVLVATDIAARGLDINQLPHVVNFDLPNVPEDYVHRIGRTGRAGNDGKAVSLVCIDEHKLLADIERLLRREIDKVILPDFKPDPSIKAVPIVNGSAARTAPGQPRHRQPVRRAGAATRK